VTYGHFLDRAAAALHTARAAASGRVPGHADAAAAVAGRAHLYHGLSRLVGLLAGRTQLGPVTLAAADHLVNSPRRVAAAGPAGVLSTGLRAATAGWAAGTAPPARAAESAVALAWRQSADAVAAAGDILASHLGGRGPARTPEGRAIILGAGRAAALADIAALALAAVAADRRMPRWLTGRGTDRTLHTVYRPATDRIRWWTGSGYPAALRGIAASTAGETAGQSVLRLLEVAPATEQSPPIRPVTSLSDVAAVLQVARAWLMQHPGDMQLRHLCAATRLAITIAAVHQRLGGGDHPTDPGWQLDRWRAVATWLPRFTDGGATRPPPRLVVQLDAATDWLHTHLTADLAAVPAAVPVDRAPDGRVQLLGALPGLADALRVGLLALAAPADARFPPRLYARGAAIDLESTPRRGIFYARARWEPAGLDHDDLQILLGRLRSLTPADPDTALTHTLNPTASQAVTQALTPAAASPARTRPPPAAGLAFPHLADVSAEPAVFRAAGRATDPATPSPARTR